MPVFDWVVLKTNILSGVVCACILSVWMFSGCSRKASKDPVAQFHTLTLKFEGPGTSESAVENPFTDYRLLVRFTHKEEEFLIRGFYGADGNAAETSADSGRIWMARFTPNRLGEWNYEASLKRGDMIAIDDNPDMGETINLSKAKGSFVVVPSTVKSNDFRAHGRLVADSGHFRFKDSGEYWIKGGSGSPENLLAFEGIDGTFRQKAESRKGEASTDGSIHRYEPHIIDWQEGDPVWQGEKGKGLIGLINYLASESMNSIYFLTLNVFGDGKDVWPYTGYDERDRFDCSKLDQWEIIFSHMQAKGILIHMVTQETENETMLDEGNTGPERKLYYRELIARFGHHLGLVWNLGEENGPAEWTPNGQSTEQRMTMASYIKSSDPYNHPVVVHTHSDKEHKEEMLDPLLGFEPLDGFSFQVNPIEEVHGEFIKWRERGEIADHSWLITMDEIGPWHTGLVPDSIDPNHDALRRFVLWGSLMGGGAGVEWYFGAQFPHNDLTAEDLRTRANMWKQTRYATDFFREYLPYWKMTPAGDLTDREDDYCLVELGKTYAIYIPQAGPVTLDFGAQHGSYTIDWYNPRTGGSLQSGSGKKSIGSPLEQDEGDWVALVRRK